MHQNIWIAYDLGVQGDYQGLYRWLDQHEAKECGDSLAFLRFEYAADLLAELKTALENAMKVDTKTRAYVLHYNAEDKDRHGTFLFGDRRAAPWTGYAPKVGADKTDVG